MPKVKNISAYEAYALEEIPPNTVIISINEEHGDLYKLKVGGKQVLRVKLTDCFLPFAHKQKQYQPASPESIKEIYNFIVANIGKDVIVQCAAGVSRSGAVAIFLNQYFDYELKDHFWLTSEPNAFIFGALAIEYLKRESSEL